MHRLHESNIGVYGLFVRSNGIGKQRDSTHSTLDGVQQRQTGKDPHGQLFLFRGQSLPRGYVVAQRHLLR